MNEANSSNCLPVEMGKGFIPINFNAKNDQT